jgi:hypothetical protein
MTLSQTTLAQNGNNNPSSSKKCTALEEENNCLREKLSNEEQKSSTAKALRGFRDRIAGVRREFYIHEKEGDPPVSSVIAS